jgi:hypothetical protein
MVVSISFGHSRRMYSSDTKLIDTYILQRSVVHFLADFYTALIFWFFCLGKRTNKMTGQHRATFEQAKKTKKQSTNYKPISYEKYNIK